MDETKLLVLADRFRKLRDQVDSLATKQLEIQTIKGDQGPKGEQGDRGFDGAPGSDGDNGADGRDGQDGKDGISVVNAEIAMDGSLVLYLSDGSEIDCGEVGQAKTENIFKSLTASGGASTLSSIQDILITDPQNNDVLTYNSATSKWVNQQISPKITVSAVAPTSPNTGDIWFDIS